MILALLFWNQILICDSLRLSSWASDCLRCSVMYRLAWNSAFSLCSCSAVKAVLGRLSSFSLFFFFNFRVLGPSVETTIKRRHKYHEAIRTPDMHTWSGRERLSRNNLDRLSKRINAMLTHQGLYLHFVRGSLNQN